MQPMTNLDKIDVVQPHHNPHLLYEDNIRAAITCHLIDPLTYEMEGT
jgi:hypothetical protein